MKRVTYHQPTGTENVFDIQLDEKAQVKAIRHQRDPHEMNWAAGAYPWGNILCSLDLSVDVTRELTKKDTLVETYCFVNETEFDIYTFGTQLGICTPFPDYYTDASYCMTQCCHTHPWCGENSSYVMALRMGGEAPHLGMVLLDGSLKGYSVERRSSYSAKEEELSNHRGDFILHPENFVLHPGESYCIQWELFWFRHKEDFQEKLKAVPGYLWVEGEKQVLFKGEEIVFQICSQLLKENTVEILREDQPVPYEIKNGKAVVKEAAKETGEYVYHIRCGKKHTKAAFLVKSNPEQLAQKRCRFIAEKQQCYRKDSVLNGAYLIYDNEEQQQYYGHRNDYNGGRERVGMGVLMAHYLQKHPDEILRESLNQYIAYVKRELFDEETGEVFNDAGRCNDYIRLYNYPWMSLLFLEMYHLTKEESYLEDCYRCLVYFYNAGGTQFYALCVPMLEAVEVFRKAGRIQQAESLLEYFETHGQFVMLRGKNYLPSEVDYEQSIVAPAAAYMCELYHLTGKEEYRQGALEQLAVLDLFQASQPDYHMNEVAIRHWDGYWFGKRKCLGDTYPHYWSALTGYAYKMAEGICGAEEYVSKAEKNIRAVLSLIFEDGSASCAMVYPMTVNGQPAAFFDPWANDQDWGLYCALKILENV